MTSILDAVRYLGTDVLSGLLLSAQIFAALAAGSAPSFSAATLRDRSLKAAAAARRLATVPGTREEIYAATLLCDVGQLVLSCAAPIAFERILQTAQGRTAAQPELELETFGVTHAEIGGHLLGL